MARLCGTHHVRLDDGTCWARVAPGDASLEWLLRYGSPERIIEKRFVIASIVASYDALLCATQKRRNEVVRAIRSVEPAQPESEG